MKRIIDQAACVQMNADPKIMTSAKIGDHLKALKYCTDCPVTADCILIVRPAESYFDGTVGGRLFNNGRDVTRHVADNRFKKYFIYKHANYTSIRQVRKALLGRVSPLDLNHYEKMLYIFLKSANGTAPRALADQFKISLLAVRYIVITVERDLPESVRVKVMSWQELSAQQIA